MIYHFLSRIGVEKYLFFTILFLMVDLGYRCPPFSFRHFNCVSVGARPLPQSCFYDRIRSQSSNMFTQRYCVCPFPYIPEHHPPLDLTRDMETRRRGSAERRADVRICPHAASESGSIDGRRCHGLLIGCLGDSVPFAGPAPRHDRHPRSAQIEICPT